MAKFNKWEIENLNAPKFKRSGSRIEQALEDAFEDEEFQDFEDDE